MLLNIYSNAIKFTGRDGRITLVVELINNQEPESEDFLKMLRISVIDDGLGIKKKDQALLFQMYGTIKHEKKGINTKGIGLGLHISKLIVEKFKGRINFFSKYKKGTTFYYSFEVFDYDVL